MADDPRDMLADAARDLLRRNRDTVGLCVGTAGLFTLFLGAGMAFGWGWFLMGIGGFAFWCYLNQRSG
jgi:hypothetical protein